MPSPAMLVTLDQAKKQLRIEHDESDLDIYQKLADAEAIIVTFLGSKFDEAWDETTVPGAVRAAILKQVTYLWKWRGDEDKAPAGDSGVAPGVRWLLQSNGYLDISPQ